MQHLKNRDRWYKNNCDDNVMRNENRKTKVETIMANTTHRWNRTVNKMYLMTELLTEQRPQRETSLINMSFFKMLAQTCCRRSETFPCTRSWQILKWPFWNDMSIHHQEDVKWGQTCTPRKLGRRSITSMLLSWSAWQTFCHVAFVISMYPHANGIWQTFGLFHCVKEFRCLRPD